MGAIQVLAIWSSWTYQTTIPWSGQFHCHQEDRKSWIFELEKVGGNMEIYPFLRYTLYLVRLVRGFWNQNFDIWEGKLVLCLQVKFAKYFTFGQFLTNTLNACYLQDFSFYPIHQSNLVWICISVGTLHQITLNYSWENLIKPNINLCMWLWYCKIFI